MLPENVFDEVFGKTLRTLESASDLPGGGNSSTNNLSSTKNDKKATKVLDLLESKFGEIHRGRTNHVPPNELKLNSKGGSDDPKQLVIKPPILIPDLAARLGLKPFNIMADLIKIGTFPAPNRPLEPEIAARICEIHGFTLERERADKERGKGSPTNLENGHLKSGGTGRFLGVLDT